MGYSASVASGASGAGVASVVSGSTAGVAGATGFVVSSIMTIWLSHADKSATIACFGEITYKTV
jgi:hypothetical protein